MISQYLESGLLNHLFRGATFPKPSSVCLALTSGVPQRTDNGTTLSEISTTVNGSGTGYARLNLGDPSATGDSMWTVDVSGEVNNTSQLVFNTALLDWGWVSGLAVLDSPVIGSGNVLMFAQLDNPRAIFMGDSPKFDASTLQISFS